MKKIKKRIKKNIQSIPKSQRRNWIEDNYISYFISDRELVHRSKLIPTNQMILNDNVTKTIAVHRLYHPEKIILTSLQIASQILTLIHQHRASWDKKLGEHTLGLMWDDRIAPFLYQHSHYSSFAATLLLYGYQAPMEEICKEVINKKLI